MEYQGLMLGIKFSVLLTTLLNWQSLLLVLKFAKASILILTNSIWKSFYKFSVCYIHKQRRWWLRKTILEGGENSHSQLSVKNYQLNPRGTYCQKTSPHFPHSYLRFLKTKRVISDSGNILWSLPRTLLFSTVIEQAKLHWHLWKTTAFCVRLTEVSKSQL